MVVFILHQARQAEEHLLAPWTAHPAIGLIQLVLKKFKGLIAFGTSANHAWRLKLWFPGLMSLIHSWAFRA